MWSTTRRASSLVEHICEHGTGHPNFYSVYRLWSKDYIDSLSDYEYDRRREAIIDRPGQSLFETSHWWTHGCDGCCCNDSFPGRELTTGEIFTRLADKIDEFDACEMDMPELISWFKFTTHDLEVNEALRG